MILDSPLITDLVAIRERRQAVIDDNLRRQNLKRRFFDYTVGQQILIKQIDPTKLGEQTCGPFQITQVHVNGNVTVQRAPHIFERVNIRRVVPFWLPNQL